MQLLSHEDPNVRYEALVAVQKLMVHNWYAYVHIYLSQQNSLKGIFVFREYLGKQLEKENVEGTKPTQGGATAISGKA